MNILLLAFSRYFDAKGQFSSTHSLHFTVILFACQDPAASKHRVLGHSPIDYLQSPTSLPGLPTCYREPRLATRASAGGTSDAQGRAFISLKRTESIYMLIDTRLVVSYRMDVRAEALA